MTAQRDPEWRANGPYTTSNVSKAGLVEETRLYFQTYARAQDVRATYQALITGALAQRARRTREGILEIIQLRLVSWRPPEWVLQDLADFAAASSPIPLQAALLLHVPRQDRLLYDVVQQLIVRRWQAGQREVTRSDVQRFLDEATPVHPEIERWSHSTREKLSGNLLSILRDYGLFQGTAHKKIVEPVVPLEVAAHLARLLQAEGVTTGEMAHHPDWRLWLWDADRAQAAILQLEHAGDAPWTS